MKFAFIRKIAIVFNLKKKGITDDSCEEYDDVETINALEIELKNAGLSVFRIEQSKNIFRDLLKAKPDFVFNIAEGIGVTRARESQIPCIFESLKIPYSGSDPITLGITLDKYLTNIILNLNNIPVPKAFIARNNLEIRQYKYLFKTKKLFIIKPRWEGSSRGIFLNSVVNDFNGFKRQANFILVKYKQPVLIEEFLEKEEITVGVCGNDNPFILGMMRITAKQLSEKYFLYSQENKRLWEERIKYEPASAINKSIRKRIEKYAIESFKTLELRDIARIDFRLDREGNPKIIDVNPLPGLSPYYSDLPIICKLKGKNYGYLIRTILNETLKRNRLRIAR